MDISRTASVQANLQTELLQSFQSFSLQSSEFFFTSQCMITWGGILHS